MVALALTLVALIFGVIELLRTRGQGIVPWAIVCLGFAGLAGWLRLP